MPHVDDGTLHALLDGALRAHEPDRADRVEAHLDACADCRARLEEAAALRDRAADVLADLDAGLAPDAAAARGATDRPGAADRPGATEADLEPVPDFQDVLARAAGPDTATATSDPDRDPGLRRRYGWTRGLAWAATIVVALGTGYMVRDLAGPTGVVPRAATMESVDRADDRAGDLPAGAGGARADGLDADDEPAMDAAGQTDPGQQAGPAQQTEQAGERPALRAPADESGVTPEPEAEAAGTDAVAPAPTVAYGEASAEVDPRDPAAATQWRPVPVEEVGTDAGPLFVLPGATIATAEMADDGTVRTRQRLPDGVEVVVVQEGIPTAVNDDVVAAADPVALRDQAGREQARLRAVSAMAPSEAVPALVGLDLDSAAAAVASPATVTVLRDGLSLTLTASLPEDVLRALAATAAPRTP